MLKPAFWGETHTGRDRQGHRRRTLRCISLRKICRTAYWFRGAIAVSCVGAGMAVLIHEASEHWDNGIIPQGEFIFFNPSVYTSFSFILGFILTFRTNQAYQRYWEGATLLEQMMGNWYDAASSLVAFCGYSSADNEKIMEFQHVLARLLSLINAVILCELAGEELEPEALKYNLLDATGLDKATLRVITKAECRPELIFQKIQTLLVTNMSNGVLSVPPPILTRAFQQMSSAMLNFHDATKLRLIPFPAPYIAVAYLLTVVHVFIAPIIALNWTYTMAQAACMSFIQIFIVVSLLQLANGLDNPFDPLQSGLDLEAVHTSFNQRMICLIQDGFSMEAPKLNRKAMATAGSSGSIPLAERLKPGSKEVSVPGQPGTPNDGRHTLRDIYARYNTETSLDSDIPPEGEAVLGGGGHTPGGDVDMAATLSKSSSQKPGVTLATGPTLPTGSMGKVASSNRRPVLDRGIAGSNLMLPSLASPKWAKGKLKGNVKKEEDSDEEDGEDVSINILSPRQGPPTRSGQSTCFPIIDELQPGAEDHPSGRKPAEVPRSESSPSRLPAGRRRLGESEARSPFSQQPPTSSVGSKETPKSTVGFQDVDVLIEPSLSEDCLPGAGQDASRVIVHMGV